MITVKDFIVENAIEGLRRAPLVFMEQIENELRRDALISEAGSAQNLLQKYISEAEAVLESQGR